MIFITFYLLDAEDCVPQLFGFQVGGLEALGVCYVGTLAAFVTTRGDDDQVTAQLGELIIEGVESGDRSANLEFIEAVPERLKFSVFE
jgi:hypothetical protein